MFIICSLTIWGLFLLLLNNIITDHSKAAWSHIHRHTSPCARQIQWNRHKTHSLSTPQLKQMTQSMIEMHISSSGTHTSTLLDWTDITYHITGYPMVSHHAPTYFHSGNDTYTHQLEPTCIHHANVTATNRTLTIYLLSSRSFVIPVVSSHAFHSPIHYSQDINKNQGHNHKLVSFHDQELVIGLLMPHYWDTATYIVISLVSLVMTCIHINMQRQYLYFPSEIISPSQSNSLIPAWVL